MIILKSTCNKHLLSRFNHSFSRISLNYMRQNLNNVFSNQVFMLNLSKETNIFPYFFSQQMVNEFFQFNNIQSYMNYVSHKKKESRSTKKSDEVSSIFNNYSINHNCIAILQCYLDWIHKVKLKDKDDFYKNRISLQIFDLKRPNNWFMSNPGRQFIYHHGPTNSGKTSSALTQLKHLDKSKKGIYMAPLRLLAWEMQQKLGNCNLITGQDKQFKISNLTSCTIETFNENEEYDTAIIDQIQMIGDHQRGWAWTKAILGLKARRIHLCGDERALNIISKLVKMTNGTLQQKRYSRLSKLLLIHKKFQLENIEPGDCLIKFNVKQLIYLRNKINQIKIQPTNKLRKKSNQSNNQQISPTAIVYGRLPPQCRKIQANNFNQNISPYIVATNAIGMGLNLNIKKIIFTSIIKRTYGGNTVQLQQHQIQQIAGRAGRGEFDGYVQCTDQYTLKKVRKALKHVNKTYGINLQDLKVQTQKQNQGEQDELLQKFMKSHQQKKQINQFLNRPLLENQKKIKNAGIFIQLQYLKKIKIQLQFLYKKQVSLKTVFTYIFHLSKFDKSLFTLVSKQQFFQILQILQKFQLQIQDCFQLAIALSMKLIGSWSKKIMVSYAKQFKQKYKVNVPISDIKYRNSLNYPDQSLNLKILQQNYNALQIYIYLWNKYEFAFWDLQNAKILKQQIIQKMKKILQKSQPFLQTNKKPQDDNKEKSIFQNKNIMKESSKLWKSSRHRHKQLFQRKNLDRYKRKVAIYKNQKFIDKFQHQQKENKKYSKKQAQDEKQFKKPYRFKKMIQSAFIRFNLIQMIKVASIKADKKLFVLLIFSNRKMFFKSLKIIRGCFHVQIDPSKLQKISAMPFFALFKDGINLTLQKQYQSANLKYTESLKQIQQNKQQSQEHYILVLKKILQNQLLMNKPWSAQETLYKIIKSKKQFNKNPIVVYEDYETLIKVLMKFNIQKAIKLGKALTSQKQIQKLPVGIQKNIRLMMGNGYLLLNNYPDAKNKFSQVLQMSPNLNLKGMAQNNLALACWWHKNPIDKLEHIQDVVKYEQSRINRDFKQVKQMLMNSLASFQNIQELQEEKAVILEDTLNQKNLNKSHNFSSIYSIKAIHNLIQYYIYNDPIQKNLIMEWINILLKASTRMKQDQMSDQITAKSALLNGDITTLQSLVPNLVQKYKSKPVNQKQYLKMQIFLHQNDPSLVKELQIKIAKLQQSILSMDPYYLKRKYILQSAIDII